MHLPKGNVAFVTGINGISGNAIVEHLIRQPENVWSRIIITSRTPLRSFWQDYRVEFVAIDFLDSLEVVISKMDPICREVTHAYFTSYVHNDNPNVLREKNTPLFTNFLTAIDKVAGESLQRVCLQTGGKHYGAHIGPTHAPMSEDLTPRREDGYNFYYPQEDLLIELSSVRKWGYNVIRPNAIIGFTPAPNGMNELLKLSQYLIICREIGEKPKFPGNEFYFNFVDDKSWAPSLADLTVWATTNEHAKNEAFNHANGDVPSWRTLFPRIGKYFGLEIPDITEWAAKGNTAGIHETEIHLTDWARDKRPVWEKICAKYGGSPESFDWAHWAYFDWATSRTWLAIASISKARRYGWNRYDDTFDTWVKTIRMYENAGILPSQRMYKAPVGETGEVEWND